MMISAHRVASQRPGDHARRVLLAVSGLSPQIITETLYALAVAADPEERFVPTEIHVLTTTEGAQRVRLALLSEQPGGFHALRRDYELPFITFGEAQIHEVAGPDGLPMPDIRTEADNACMADAITDRVREFTADPDCALHVSMAGGRKTMGYYAGYALSLFGREQDRLSHVLVSAPFESSFEFYYPTPVTRVIGVSGGALADASKAQVHLAQIPFVRLRSMLPADMRQGRTGFAAAVQAAGQRLAPPRMVIDVQAHRIEADGLDLTLRPWEFALLALLAHRASTGKPPLQAPGRDFHDTEWAAEVRTQLHQALGKSDVPDSVTQQLNSDASGSALAPHWSRLRNRLRDCLGSGRTAIYFDEGYTVFEDGGTNDDENNGRPKSKRRYRRKHYCVPLEAEAIEWRR